MELRGHCREGVSALRPCKRVLEDEYRFNKASGINAPGHPDQKSRRFAMQESSHWESGPIPSLDDEQFFIKHRRKPNTVRRNFRVMLCQSAQPIAFKNLAA
jgi:hypothetical protein